MGRSHQQPARGLIPWAIMAAAVVLAIGMARHDRNTARLTATVSSRTIRLPAAPELPALPQPTPAMREAAADLERAAEEAKVAAVALKRVEAEMEAQQRALEAMKADADAKANRTRTEIEEAQTQLEAQRTALERKLRLSEVILAAPRMPPVTRGLTTGQGTKMEQAARVAAMGAAPRLSPTEFNPESGAVTWPSVLADPRYADLTSAIEGRFRDRAAHGESLQGSPGKALERLIDDLIERFRKDVAHYSSGRYGKARTFLDSLRAECGEVPGH